MKPENYNERKIMISKFAALYIGSIVLIILAFVLKRGQEEKTGAGWAAGGEDPRQGLNEWISKAAGPLMQQMSRLKQLDSAYIRMVKDSAGSEVLSGIDAQIGAAEMAFSNSIDSLEGQSEGYTGLIASYRLALEGRRPLSDMRSILAIAGQGAGGNNTGAAGKKTPESRMTGRGAGDDNAAGDNKEELLRLVTALQQKDKYIAGLEEQVKTGSGSHAYPASVRALVDLKSTNSALLFDLEEERKSNQGLKELAVSLRHSNEALNNRLSQAGGGGSDESSGGPGARLNNRVAESEMQTAELSAELQLARVDCNLARADARQAVYNSRQRRDLLADALTTLTNLSRSDDAAVQKKAKEKIALLRTIASTVHD